MHFEKLNERHLPLVDAFCCVESDAILSQYNSDQRRKIKKCSKEMEDFLKNEAFEEQKDGMNTTYLLIDERAEKILGYVSLCADAIKLEQQEREDAHITYPSAPALKIARLAVNTSAMRRGFGKILIGFSAYQAQMIREYAGVFFITLDCYKHRVSFYESIGFQKNEIQPAQQLISMRLSLNDYLDNLNESEP